MSFVQRLLTFQISLANGSFDGGGNSATLSGLQASVKITNAGPPSMGLLSADIYGLSLSKMNQLTTLGTQQNLIGQNSIVVMAGDGDAYGNPIGAPATVFQGTIDVAFVNAQAMPQVAFHVEAHAGAVQAVKPMDPTSMKGNADVSQLFSTIAQGMGLQLENSGVSGQIANPYLWGSGRNQVLSLAKAVGVQWDMDNATLAVWPSGQARQGGAVTISPQTGMVGYPAFNQAGIIVRTLFDPSMNLKMGGQITVQSDLTPACGDWVITNLEYDLQSMIPRGDWFAIANAIRTGQQQIP